MRECSYSIRDVYECLFCLADVVEGFASANNNSKLSYYIIFICSYLSLLHSQCTGHTIVKFGGRMIDHCYSFIYLNNFLSLLFCP